jgi:hypothetical protein
MHGEDERIRVEDNTRKIATTRIEFIPKRHPEAVVDKFDAMQMFVRIIEKGSFSVSQRNAGLASPPSANRSPPLKMSSAPSLFTAPHVPLH